jgi:hypothetical protein
LTDLTRDFCLDTEVVVGLAVVGVDVVGDLLGLAVVGFSVGVDEVGVGVDVVGVSVGDGGKGALEGLEVVGTTVKVRADPMMHSAILVPPHES